MYLNKKALLAALTVITTGFATQAFTQDEIEEQTIIGVKERLERAGLLKNVIEQTELIGNETLVDTRSVSLTEAMQDSPGVIVANECSMCGYKRIQLNGLKAEHTNIFVDGLPVHTIVSGFYAVDAVAMTGVERIEVARGSGASMTAPEAIGGVVNIVTAEAYENGGQIDIAGGETGFQQGGLLGTFVSEDESARFTVVGQYDNRDQFDADDNGVSENPFLENKSLSGRLSWDITNSDNLVLRLAFADQEVFGGPMLGSLVSSIDAAIASESLGESAQLFVGDDVRNDYIGNAWETSEWVSSDRVEYSASWLREINADWNMTLSLSGSEHDQDSYYEGFDYAASDEMLYSDVRFNYALNADHLLTFGLDKRDEEMRTRSEAGEAVNSDDDPDTVYVSDNFDYNVTGLYIQDSWVVSDNLDVNIALRYDQVEADFTDPLKPGLEIDESILSPRIDARYTHDDMWTSRFSLGRGYRAPLSFFETDHGILDAEVGFELDVDALERSVTASYALSYAGDNLISTVSISHTDIDNLAALDETVEGVPLLTQLDENAGVTSYDLSMSYTPIDHLTLSMVASVYDHDDQFKSSFGVATTEEQINLNADWGVNGWDIYAALSWIGGRDLDNYGYEGFNDVAATIAKTTDAPSFYWLDIQVSREIGENWTFYAGANNLLDNTQAADEDTPLMFDADGGYDVAYIYGLLRGREMFAGVKYAF